MRSFWRFFGIGFGATPQTLDRRQRLALLKRACRELTKVRMALELDNAMRRESIRK